MGELREKTEKYKSQVFALTDGWIVLPCTEMGTRRLKLMILKCLWNTLEEMSRGQPDSPDLDPKKEASGEGVDGHGDIDCSLDRE